MAERLRIARELHDIVAHSIGIIAIQAGAGRRVFDARPAEARDALAAIEATSRETLSGLRRMVTGLRRAEPGPGPGQAPLGPAPGLADIERLAAMTLEAGVQVDVDWHGSRSRSRLTSTCRRSASSRRRSPTWSAMPARASAGS